MADADVGGRTQAPGRRRRRRPLLHAHKYIIGGALETSHTFSSKQKNQDELAFICIDWLQLDRDGELNRPAGKKRMFSVAPATRGKSCADAFPGCHTDRRPGGHVYALKD